MRGDTENEDSSPDDDRFTDQWEGIVSSLPELADLDVDAAAADVDRPRASGRRGKSRRGKTRSDPTTADESDPSTPEQVRAANATPPGPRDWLEAENEDDDHFTPPELPPMKTRGFLTTLCWVILCAAPALLVAFLFFWSTAPRILMTVLVVLFFASAAILILRRPKHRPLDEDPGDHAVL